LHTNLVEDYTGTGIQDLLVKPLIRNYISFLSFSSPIFFLYEFCEIGTPIDPLQTFLDDPLRILRVVRFASRFNFPLDPKIMSVCAENAGGIHEAFTSKISRERIGKPTHLTDNIF
jgi:hypothetical protein